MGNKELDAVILMVSDHHGQYVPQQFLRYIEGVAGWKNIKDEDRSILETGPEHEQYWDAWDKVLDQAQFLADNGDVYTLWQDGDLWAYCFERMTDEEKHNLGFND